MTRDELRSWVGNQIGVNTCRPVNEAIIALLDALEWYADPRNWNRGLGGESDAMDDAGGKARAALAGNKEGE